ncbi:uncharacterized protein TM35_000211460 [Trypanosoma theileri]|uniref:Thioredoxin domain-containing protein n=1 Tax=Trypanosoma theileri TaxID=67003 RepID=A0A1X0NTU8_9TRYP|nr:uncharacterized protein TM35_000211460 [Trypanosoma theileri]ORC87540.1 hypothetical protein TM35_000211460 [Trypanosoma theileri]
MLGNSRMRLVGPCRWFSSGSRHFCKLYTERGGIGNNWTLFRYSPMISNYFLCTSYRSMVYKTDAASFESEVIQSQQAICLVYYRPDSSSCNAYLTHAERLVNRLNEETNQTKNTNEDNNNNNSSNSNESSTRKLWLKLCTINADENRNLASAFSVERAKLPVTYFIMQGTIIDKVTGHIIESRLEGILRKFLEHYQKQMNVDLISGGGSSNQQNPLPAAATTDLLHGASTQYLQNRIMDSLVGPERIRLPEESEQLDGLRKTIQQAKKKAYDELQDLRRELGMDVRRLSEMDMTKRYYHSSQFTALAVLSALEALFLARVHATIGDIAAENVVFALNAIQRDFSPILGDPSVRRLISLCEVLLVRAEILLQERKLQSLGENENVEKYFSRMQYWIDELVDARVVPERFPSEDVEEMFRLLKSNLAEVRGRSSQEEVVNESTNRVRQVKTCLLGVLQLYHNDPKSQEARSRLSSLLY